MRSDIVPGAIFPDYELSDHTGKRRKLSDLQGQHPMVLVLSRGGYCPKDRRQAEGLARACRDRAATQGGQMRRLGRELEELADDAEAGRPVAARLFDLETQIAGLRRAAV